MHPASLDLVSKSWKNHTVDGQKKVNMYSKLVRIAATVVLALSGAPFSNLLGSSSCALVSKNLAKRPRRQDIMGGSCSTFAGLPHYSKVDRISQIEQMERELS